jgi:hypothetical protein
MDMLHQLLIRRVIFVVGLAVGFGTVWSEEPTAVPAFPRVGPTEPEQAGKTFHSQRQFQMQLLAAEPLVADPVDVAYDEDGRAYVAEMRDYPYPEEKGAVPTKFPGRITLLEDRDGNGVFDTSHLFADQLSWPTSVACWKGGVFVAAAPDIWYFRDEDGDHRAEVRRRVYTGFSRENVQAIVNGLRWGLDNRIYGAASGNGGSIVPSLQAAVGPVAVTRHDFRFDPLTEKFEAIPGGARFGNSFDDWGNRCATSATRCNKSWCRDRTWGGIRCSPLPQPSMTPRSPGTSSRSIVGVRPNCGASSELNAGRRSASISRAANCSGPDSGPRPAA